MRKCFHTSSLALTDHVMELSEKALDTVVGGAFQAHIAVKGHKQGQFKSDNAALWFGDPVSQQCYGR
jgi:hypothetical protein